MNVLTRLPRDLRARLEAADPARDLAGSDGPDPDDLIARAERETAVRQAPIRPRHPRRMLAPIAAVAAVVLAVAAVVAIRNGHHSQPSPAAAVGPAFPVTAVPRPVVLIGDPVVAGGFPSGDTKLAFANGAIDLATSLPATPTRADGYPVLSAAAAVRRLTDARSCCGTTRTRLRIDEVALSRHTFATDRGVRSLPAWRVDFVGVPYYTYVLAVAPSARFPRTRAYSASAGDAVLSRDGRRLTIWVTAHHQSRDACDIGFRQSLTTAVGTHAVRLAVTTTYDLAPAAKTPTRHPIMYCDLIGRQQHQGTVLRAGAPDTRTITLDQPLGNRIVVDGQGRPYVVTTG